MVQLRLPSPGVITSKFGWRIPGKVGSAYHQGIDFGWGNGWAITAAASGTVAFAGYQAGYGNLTVIDHGNGVETRYAHQSKISVHKGQQVNAGQNIGVIGNTGTSNAPHLHFELLVNGRRIDPAPHFGSTAADDITPIIIPPTEEDDMQYWRYTPNGMIAVLDTVRMEYRYPNKYECMVIDNLEKAGKITVSGFTEPAWTETLASWRLVTAPVGGATFTITDAQVTAIAAAVADESDDLTLADAEGLLAGLPERTAEAVRLRLKDAL